MCNLMNDDRKKVSNKVIIILSVIVALGIFVFLYLIMISGGYYPMIVNDKDLLCDTVSARYSGGYALLDYINRFQDEYDLNVDDISSDTDFVSIRYTDGTILKISHIQDEDNYKVQLSYSLSFSDTSKVNKLDCLKFFLEDNFSENSDSSVYKIYNINDVYKELLTERRFIGQFYADDKYSSYFYIQLFDKEEEDEEFDLVINNIDIASDYYLR